MWTSDETLHLLLAPTGNLWFTEVANPGRIANIGVGSCWHHRASGNATGAASHSHTRLRGLTPTTSTARPSPGAGSPVLVTAPGLPIVFAHRAFVQLGRVSFVDFPAVHFAEQCPRCGAEFAAEDKEAVADAPRITRRTVSRPHWVRRPCGVALGGPVRPYAPLRETFAASEAPSSARR